jgi:hypothetical protein
VTIKDLAGLAWFISDLPPNAVRSRIKQNPVQKQKNHGLGNGFFTVEETFNKQNNRVYAQSSKEACKFMP